MHAVRFNAFQQFPVLEEVPRLSPGPGEVLLTWGTVEDLHEVVAMYRAGQIAPEVERCSLPEALEAYRRLEQGQVTGRAVVVPHA